MQLSLNDRPQSRNKRRCKFGPHSQRHPPPSDAAPPRVEPDLELQARVTLGPQDTAHRIPFDHLNIFMPQTHRLEEQVDKEIDDLLKEIEDKEFTREPSVALAE